MSKESEFVSFKYWLNPFFLGQWPHRKGSFEDPYPVYKEVKMLQCYKMALKTWSAWLETHVNRTKTRLFFVSNSATHSRYGGNLINELMPLTHCTNLTLLHSWAIMKALYIKSAKKKKPNKIVKQRYSVTTCFDGSCATPWYTHLASTTTSVPS